jgi:large subunit ribosomal protein L10
VELSQKKEIVADLNDRFQKSKVLIVTDYKGLDVSAMNDLRRKLREAEVDYQVVKNTLLIRAAEGTDVDLIKDSFTGPSAIAVSYTDPVAPAKVLTDFAKENDKFDIKIGVMDGKVLDAANIKALSSLPSREVLLSQILSAMNAVPTKFVQTLDAIPSKVVRVLAAIRDQKEAA